MARLAELFSISTDAARAAAVVDEITSHRSTDPDRDWAVLEHELRRCYASVLDARERARA